MDVVIGNTYIDVFSSLNIDVSKKLEGEYNVDEILSNFNNFFFNRMFLDITAIKDYKNLYNLQKLSMGINMDKVIILLDGKDTISDSKQFLSKLVSMGIYNFTKDVNALMYLYKNPNGYRDVAYYQNIDKEDANIELSNSNVTQDLHINNDRIILGIKNVTDEAGSTTLVYLLMKILSDYYNTMAIEVDRGELIYFNDKNTLTVKENDLDGVFDKYKNINFFIVDLGKCKKEYLCTDVLYLIEPSTIKLNKLMVINPNIFKELNGKKIILNKSLLSDIDIANFEVEADVKFYYEIEPLNDKEDCSSMLLPLLEKLGYVKVVNNEDGNSDKKGFFGLFK